jgi:hypothetical protein
MNARTFLDISSYVTMAITLVLFVAALFAQGVPHDLMLEAGVFLVSAKLVIMSYRSAHLAENLESELKQIRALLETRPR